MCPVENAEGTTFPSKAQKSWFHLSGQHKPACDINPPATSDRHTNHLSREPVWFCQYRITSNNKQTEQRCGVPFEGQGIITTPIDRKIDVEFMNLFFRFVTSITRISVECPCCSDSAELRYQLDRYSTIRIDVEFRALAVRHGGLNGYQGQ